MSLSLFKINNSSIKMYYNLFSRITSRTVDSFFHISREITSKHIFNPSVISSIHYTPVKLAFKELDPSGVVLNKPPIIFMHGIALSKESWKDIPQTVANVTNRKVYAIDARNHGDTEWNDVFNFDCNVDDILHFMDSIGAPKAILIGHSMGGITGIKTALRAPERVEKLVVEDMYVKRMPQNQLNSLKMYLAETNSVMEAVPTGYNERATKQFISDYFNRKCYQQQKGERLSLSDIQIKQGEDGRYRYKANVPVLERALENFETLATESTGVYHGPTCFIFGTLSPFLEDAEIIRRSFPNAELVRIENATHNVHNDSPKEFTDSLLKSLLKL